MKYVVAVEIKILDSAVVEAEYSADAESFAERLMREKWDFKTDEITVEAIRVVEIG